MWLVRLIILFWIIISARAGFNFAKPPKKDEMPPEIPFEEPPEMPYDWLPEMPNDWPPEMPNDWPPEIPRGI